MNKSLFFFEFSLKPGKPGVCLSPCYSEDDWAQGKTASISPLSKMLAKAVAIPVNSNQIKGIS